MNRNSGFSLIEVMVVMAILAIVSMAYSLFEIQNAIAAQNLEENDIKHATASSLLARIQTLPFGSTSQPYPTGRQLEMVFGSSDPVGRGFPSLSQLSQASPIWFELEGTRVDGKWTVYVDNDLDGNGTVDKPTWVEGEPTWPDDVFAREGLDDLLRIEIQYKGQTVLRTMQTISPSQRAAEEQ